MLKVRSTISRVSIKEFLVSFPSLFTSLDEYSNFNKNFQKKAPKQKSELTDFLTMFDKGERELPNENERVDEAEFFEMDGVTIKTEGFFCTKLGQVKGTVTLKADVI